MVQTAAMHYSNMPNGHFSSPFVMNYPSTSPAFYQDSAMSRLYPPRRESSSAQSYSSRTAHSQQAAWNQQQQQQQQQRQQQHQQQQQQQQHQQKHQQQQQQPSQQSTSSSTSPSSSAPSLPRLSEALNDIFTDQASSQTQTQTQQPRVTIQQPSDTSSVSIQQVQAYQAQQVASAYQQGLQYGDVNAPYVLADTSYASPTTSQVAQQIVSQTASTSATGLPPIVATNAASDISANMMVTSSPSTRHNRQGSAQMLALNNPMLPAQDSASGSQLTVTPIQGPTTLSYTHYPTSLHHQQMLANPATAVYGPPSAMGHRRTHSTSSSASTSSTQHDDDANSSSGEHQKVFSFVALPGVNTKKRPRRKYEEIERHYACNFPGCAKSYGTLNHLNAHVQMQKHGQKRHPSEFKELRKQWRRQKREEAIKKAAEDAGHNAQR